VTSCEWQDSQGLNTENTENTEEEKKVLLPNRVS
jgi:hypothetical protein